MGHRRPEPENFTERLERLVELEKERDKLSTEIDNVFLSLVDEQASTTSIAEHLGIKVGSVSSRMTTALRRRRARQQQESSGDVRAA
jgi:DNA-directed RNA polymerase specialized sigma24 family protein